MIKHFYGYKPSKPDERDYKYIAPVEAVELPAKVDLRYMCSPIRDQGQLGSCTWEAMVGLMEFTYPKAPAIKSVLFGYYNTRLLEGTVNEDSGCYPRDVFKVAQKTGDCKNKYCQYIIKNFAKRPSKTAYANAIYKIKEYRSLSNLTDIKTVLATTNKPVYIGFTVYESFDSEEVANTGIMPMPKWGEQILGGHAVLVVGYDDSKQWLIVRNSWGKDWGDSGYFYMSYDFVNHPGYVSDKWAVTY